MTSLKPEEDNIAYVEISPLDLSKASSILEQLLKGVLLSSVKSGSAQETNDLQAYMAGFITAYVNTTRADHFVAKSDVLVTIDISKLVQNVVTLIDQACRAREIRQDAAVSLMETLFPPQH